MTRLIDADALIEALKKKHEHWHEIVPEEHADIEFAYTYAVNVVRNAPTIDIKPKVVTLMEDSTVEKLQPSTDTISEGWIPCSKKMPEEDGEYLVTFNGKFIDNIIKVMFYEVDKKYFSLYFPGAGDIKFQEIRAWMPLPEPYKEVDDEN